MEIKEIKDNKKQFLNLLLLGDEQESMIDRYLERGDLFALYDGDLKSVCVVTIDSGGVYEIKNLATYPQYQQQGYGKALVEYVWNHYQNVCRTMLVGTGANTPVVSFYEKCGFGISHVVPNFFTEHYDHPIFEDGVQLVDMVYLSRNNI